MRFRIVTMLVLSCFVLHAQAKDDLPMAQPESVGMSSERLERMSKWIERYVETKQIAGAVTLVARRGKVVHFEAHGWRHKEENQPMELDSIFTITGGRSRPHVRR